MKVNAQIFDRVSVLARCAVIAASATLAAQAQQAPAPPLVREGATVKVSDHVWVIPDASVPAVPNVGIIVGSGTTMIVDTGLGPRNMETVLRETAKVSKNAEMYLVTTHFHPEHAGGSAALPANAKFIMSRVQQKDIEELGMGMMAQFAGRTPLMGELLKDVQFRKPDVLFDREHTLDLGGIRVRLLSLGPTHTRGDTMVFVEQDRVLFAGDIVMNKAFLAFNNTSSTETWLKVLNEAEALRPTVIVPSHGNRGDASLIAEQRGMLQTLQARVQEMKQRARTVDQAVAELTPEFEAKYPGFAP